MRDIDFALDEEVLVLTDGQRRGIDALSLGFREAVVVDRDTRIEPASHAAAVVDVADVDGRLVSAVTAALRPGGRVLVVLGGESSVDGSERLDGLRWSGLTTVNGRPCAVLRWDPDGPASGADAASRLSEAATVASLAYADPAGPHSRAAREHATALLLRHMEARRRSEEALLGRLADLAAERDRARLGVSNTERIRAGLRRNAAGRAMLGAARRIGRVVRRPV